MSIRLFLRPLFEEGRYFQQSSGKTCRENAKVCLGLSFRRASEASEPRNLEIPGLVLAHHPGMTQPGRMTRRAPNDAGCLTFKSETLVVPDKRSAIRDLTTGLPVLAGLSRSLRNNSSLGLGPGGSPGRRRGLSRAAAGDFPASLLHYPREAASCVRSHISPGPYRSFRELSLTGSVDPDIWCPPTFVGNSGIERSNGDRGFALYFVGELCLRTASHHSTVRHTPRRRGIQ